MPVVLTDTDGTPVSAPSTVPTGQAAMANSVPVAIASDQSAVPVTNTANSYKHCTTGSNAVKASPGTLHTITVNTAASTKTATVTDGVSTIAVIDMTTVGSYVFDVATTTNLTVALSGTADVTVTYT